MKKLLISILVVIVCNVGWGQTYPINQNLGRSTSTLVSTNSIRADQGFILGTFVDTSSASALPYLKNYPGALIFTTGDSAVWVRGTGATKWIQIFGNTSGASGDTLVWKLSGNTVGARAATPVLGTLDGNDLNFMTDGSTRLTLPSGGLARNGAATTKYLTFDTITKQMYYFDGGSGSSGWSLTGNAGTTAGTNFIGTTDAIDFVLKANNTERSRWGSNGSFVGSFAADVTVRSTAITPIKLVSSNGTDSSFVEVRRGTTPNTYVDIQSIRTGRTGRVVVGGILQGGVGLFSTIPSASSQSLTLQGDVNIVDGSTITGLGQAIHLFNGDTMRFSPALGRYFIDTLNYTLSTTRKKLMLRDTVNGLVQNIDPELLVGGAVSVNNGLVKNSSGVIGLDSAGVNPLGREVRINGGATNDFVVEDFSSIAFNTTGLPQQSSAGLSSAGIVLNVTKTNGGTHHPSFLNILEADGSINLESGDEIDGDILSYINLFPDRMSFKPYQGNYEIDTLLNRSNQNSLMGWDSTGADRGQVGYIRIGSGLSLASGELTATGGGVAWNAITNPTGDQALTFDAGESSTWTNSNTTEDLFTVNSSTVTSSSYISLNRTSTALASGNNIMELVSSGANGTNGITATGMAISVTNTNATSGTNIGLNLAVSGATTTNRAIESNNLFYFSHNGLWLAGAAPGYMRSSSATGQTIVGHSDGNGANHNYTLSKIVAQTSGNDRWNTTSAGTRFGSATDATSTLQSHASFAAAYAEATGTTTLDATHYTLNCTANTFTVTLPTAVGITGRIYNIANSGAGVITIATTSSQTFVNIVATPTTLTLSAVGSYSVQSTGANWVVIGNL